MQQDEEIIVDMSEDDYSQFEGCLTHYLDCRGMVAEADDFLDRKEIKRLKKNINRKFFKKAEVISMLDEFENKKSISAIKNAKKELNQANKVGSLAWWQNRSNKQPEIAISAPSGTKLLDSPEVQADENN